MKLAVSCYNLLAGRRPIRSFGDGAFRYMIVSVKLQWRL